MPKGKRLIDVIGEQEKSQDWIVKKFKKLEITIKLHSDWNKPEGDAKTDAGWVENKIDEFDGGIVPNREVLNYANVLWKKYK
tara:strand:+ start:163 stop:408 length:246 start_codon:yes stop_codon:yes gene_type:complete